MPLGWGWGVPGKEEGVREANNEDDDKGDKGRDMGLAASSWDVRRLGAMGSDSNGTASGAFFFFSFFWTEGAGEATTACRPCFLPQTDL